MIHTKEVRNIRKRKLCKQKNFKLKIKLELKLSRSIILFGQNITNIRVSSCFKVIIYITVKSGVYRCIVPYIYTCFNELHQSTEELGTTYKIETRFTNTIYYKTGCIKSSKEI